MSAAAQFLTPQSSSDSGAKHKSRSMMDAAPWTLQLLWGVFFSLTGFGKALMFKPALWEQALHEVPWFSAVPLGLFIFIGFCQFLGGIGLILPAMTGIKPKLTPLAALGLTLVMILAAAFHLARGEYNFLLINLVLGAVAAFIAYGRSCETDRTGTDHHRSRS